MHTAQCAYLRNLAILCWELNCRFGRMGTMACLDAIVPDPNVASRAEAHKIDVDDFRRFCSFASVAIGVAQHVAGAADIVQPLQDAAPSACSA